MRYVYCLLCLSLSVTKLAQQSVPRFMFLGFVWVLVNWGVPQSWPRSRTKTNGKAGTKPFLKICQKNCRFVCSGKGRILLHSTRTPSSLSRLLALRPVYHYTQRHSAHSSSYLGEPCLASMLLQMHASTASIVGIELQSARIMSLFSCCRSRQPREQDAYLPHPARAM